MGFLDDGVDDLAGDEVRDAQEDAGDDDEPEHDGGRLRHHAAIGQRKRDQEEDREDVRELERAGEPPMRFLTMSNAHPQVYGDLYSKFAELLFILRSH